MDRAVKALGKAFLLVCAFFLSSSHVAHAAGVTNAAQAPGIMHCGSFKRAYHDFDGDCQSDLLWLNTSGGRNQQFAWWLMHGNTRVGSSIITMPNTFNAYSFGTAGDFNDDGRADLIWLDASESQSYRVVRMWINQGAGTYSDVEIGTAPSGWELAGAGDINGDGTDDLVWYNQQTCQVAFWFMGPSGRIGSRTQAIACNFRAQVVVRPTTGIADLVWQGYNASTGMRDFYLWRNNGDGSFVSSLFGSLANGGPMQFLTAGTTANSVFAFISCYNAGEPCASPFNCTGPACALSTGTNDSLLLWNPPSTGPYTYSGLAYFDNHYSVASTGNYWNSPAGTENDLVWTGQPDWSAPSGTYNVYIWRISTLNNSISTYFVDTAPDNWTLLR